MPQIDFSKSFQYPSGNRADQVLTLFKDIVARLTRIEQRLDAASQIAAQVIEPKVVPKRKADAES